MMHYRRYHLWSTLAIILAICAEASANYAGARLVIVLPFILGAWWIFRDRVESPVPRWLINILLFVATGYVFYSVSQTLQIDPERTVTVLADYLVALIAIKSFESRTPRDQAQLLILTGMLAIAAVLSSITLIVAIFLFAFAPTLLMAVMHFQIFAVMHRSFGPPGKPQPRILTSVPASGTRQFSDLGRLLVVSSLIIAVLGSIVFLIMPRGIGETDFGAIARARAGATVGFSDVIRLTGDGIISDSPSIVAEVEIFGRDERITLPTQQYFRGAVLDQYDPGARRWQRSRILTTELDDLHANRLANDGSMRWLEDRSPFGRSPRAVLDQRFRLFSKTTAHLFALWRPTNIAYRDTDAVYLNPIDWTLIRPSRAGFVEYWVRSVPSDEGLPGIEDDSEVLARYRARHRILSRGFREGPIHDHALDVLRQYGLTVSSDEPLPTNRIATALERYLRENFSYTLELQSPTDDIDPILWFLTERREGHCEHFASAMVAMCQALDIPARIVTGFVTSEFDQVRQAYIIRQRHAHAWAEVEVVEPVAVLDDSGDASIREVRRWKRFDPTPSSALAELNRPDSGLRGWLRANFDRIEQAWILRVVAFDSRAQRRFLEDVGIDTIGPVEWLQNISQRIQLGIVPTDRRAEFVQRMIDRIVVTALVLFGLTALWFAYRQWRRSARSHRHAGRGARSRVPAYTRMLRLLRRSGYHRSLGTPPLTHARSLAAVDPDIAGAAVRITDLHYACRYNNHTPTEAQLHAAESDLNLIRSHLNPRRTDHA